ncbi:MAG: pyridoxamine 5'-phosphate oxidase family protein [Pseudomonadota bacterium]
MNSEAEIEAKFWKTLKGDRVGMLALTGVEEGHSQPMTAQVLHEEDILGPIFFFTSKETDLVRGMGESHRAALHFSAKGHDLFASVHGELSLYNDRAAIDQLWNKFVAAWFEGGKDDPKLQLVRLDPDRAQVWLNENSAMAAVKLLLGRDPKQEYAGKTADVRVGRH